MAGHRIKEIYAFVAVDPKDGNEGVAALTAGDQWFPMVASDMERVESLREPARQISKAHGIDIRLIKFTQREDLGSVVEEG
jgi:hypothetical protein